MPLFKQAFETAKAVPGHPDAIELMSDLGQAFPNKQFEEALPLLKQSLELTKAQFGPDNPLTLDDMYNLAVAYIKTGRLDKALPMLQEVLRLRKLKLGPTHPETLSSMDSIAAAYFMAGRRDEALLLFEETFQLRKANLGADHPDTLLAMHKVGKFYAIGGRLEDGIKLMEAALKLVRSKIDPQHSDLLPEDLPQLLKDLAGAYASASEMPMRLRCIKNCSKSARRNGERKIRKPSM